MVRQINEEAAGAGGKKLARKQVVAREDRGRKEDGGGPIVQASHLGLQSSR